MKQSGLLLLTLPWVSTLADPVKSGHDKARIGIIGTGDRGSYLSRYLAMLPYVEITAICDTYEPHLQNFKNNIAPRARTHTDYRELLNQKDIDAVLIAAPLYLHRQMVLDAFNAGKHVFCEKALGMDIYECKDMYEAYKASGKCFFVGQQRLFDPRYMKIIDRIHKGEFGEVQRINSFWYRNNNWRRHVPSPELERHINWRLYDEYSRGLMSELACHQLQIGTWALRSLPTSVVGSGGIIRWKDGRQVEDSLSVIYQFSEGKQMTYNSVISNKFYGLEEQILCTDATIEPEKGVYYPEQMKPAAGLLQMINDVEHGLFDKIPLAGASWVPETANKMKPEYILTKEEKLQGIEPSARKFVGESHDGTPLLLQAFAKSVISGEQPPHFAEECYYASVLALLGYQAIREKRIVEFPEEARISHIY